jgi:hypothetical protein
MPYAFSMQCACAILSSVVCPTLQDFSTLFHKWHGLRKNVTEHKMCVLIFSITLAWNISHYKKKWAGYDQKCIVVFMRSTSFSCLTLIKLEFFRPFFEIYPNIKFHENPSSGNRVVSCGQTEERTDMTQLIVAFRDCANAPKNCL